MSLRVRAFALALTLAVPIEIAVFATNRSVRISTRRPARQAFPSRTTRRRPAEAAGRSGGGSTMSGG